MFLLRDTAAHGKEAYFKIIHTDITMFMVADRSYKTAVSIPANLPTKHSLWKACGG